MVFLVSLLEFLFFWIVGVYILYSVSKYRRFQRQSLKTAAAIGLTALVFGGFLLLIFDGPILRFTAGLVSIGLLKYTYSCTWGQAFDALTRTAFFTFMIYLPVAYFLETILF